MSTSDTYIQDILKVRDETPSTPRGKWNETARKVLEERYLYRLDGKVAETPDQMMWRVASAVAQAEYIFGENDIRVRRYTEEFFDILANRYFLPNSPTLMNAGMHNNQQLSACFVLPISDSIVSIFDTMKHAAIIHQSSGGTGFSFSRIRAKNSPVKSTQGVASGPVSFLRVYNAATEQIKQGSKRRGANICILRCDHPDIEEFISCKLPDKVTGLRDITNFNISVALTEPFMNALSNNGTYDIIDPQTGHVCGSKSAQHILDMICKCAWETGDPGLFFIDRVNSSPSNPVPELETIEACNPCVVGSTRLSTSRGLVHVSDLYESQERLSVTTDVRTSTACLQKVVNSSNRRAVVGVGTHDAVPVYQTGKHVPVLRLSTSHGMEITATPNHRFLTPTGFVRLDALQEGDVLYLQSGEGRWSGDWALPPLTLGTQSTWRLNARKGRGEASPPTTWSQEIEELLGYVVGNGYVRSEGFTHSLGIAINGDDTFLVDRFRGTIGGWFGTKGAVVQRPGHMALLYSGTPASFIYSLGVTSAHAHEKCVPEPLFHAPRSAVVGFLRGLFSADGSVQINEAKGCCSVRLGTSSKKLAQDVQHLLLNLGIVSVIRLRKEEGTITLLPDSHRNLAPYVTHGAYEVIIDKVNRDVFAKKVGFLQDRKQIPLTEWIANKKRNSNYEPFTTQVLHVEDAGYADVYDTTEPVTHSTIMDGFVCHNCGEQALAPNDACNLGSINLGLCVTEGYVDWDKLSFITTSAIRLLDNVVEINPLPLPQIMDTVRANRRLGLGVMGWADMLFHLRISYDSPEARDLGREVMRFVNDTAHRASEDLAQDRGAFPNFPHSIYKNGAPLRNATLTTVAPTGTISLIANCSSGIEPVFALSFQHRVPQPDGTTRVLHVLNETFSSIAEEEGFYSRELESWVVQHGTLVGFNAVHTSSAPRVPDWAQDVFKVANEISVEGHVLMQAAFQEGVDNAISKSVNLPNTATVKDIQEAYLLAYESGCKGITVFRDGCLSTGQVLNAGTSAPSVQAAIPNADPIPSAVTVIPIRERQEVVFGYTRKVVAPEGQVNITINSDEDGPFEVFVNTGRAGSDVLALSEALGRLISLNLRLPSTMSPTERLARISEQLLNIGGSRSVGFGPQRTLSLPDAVGQALSWHVENGMSDLSPVQHETVHQQPELQQGADLPAHAPRVHTPSGANICPTCGNSTLVREEGSSKCFSCGISQC